MPLQTMSPADPRWQPDDDAEFELMNDDDFELDDFDDDVETLNDVDDLLPQPDNVPVWRLIEMSRENRYLQRELADFDDYDLYDGLDDSHAGRHMH